eukprot:7550385-Lingulodinium_polyedra.AAC.1
MALRRCRRSWEIKVQACLAKLFCCRTRAGLALRACLLGKELEEVMMPILSKRAGCARSARV